MWGKADTEVLVRSRTLSCGSWMTHLIAVYTQSFLVLRCHLTQLFNVSCLVFIIFQHCSIFCHTLLLYCFSFIVNAGDVSLCRKAAWSVRWLISSYQAIHAVRLFPAWLAFFPSVHYEMQFLLYCKFLVLNGSCLTDHDSLILYITFFSNDKHGTF